MDPALRTDSDEERSLQGQAAREARAPGRRQAPFLWVSLCLAFLAVGGCLVVICATWRLGGGSQTSHVDDWEEKQALQQELRDPKLPNLSQVFNWTSDLCRNPEHPQVIFFWLAPGFAKERTLNLVVGPHWQPAGAHIPGRYFGSGTRLPIGLRQLCRLRSECQQSKQQPSNRASLPEFPKENWPTFFAPTGRARSHIIIQCI